MNTEHEVKILDIDVDEVKKKLLAIGAKKVADREMHRYVYDLPSEAPQKRWIRLRDDGEQVTLTLKEINDDTITGTKEIEIQVNDFESTAKLLEHLGFEATAYQENKRTSYKKDNIEFEIDSWPKIPPYLEIEGPDEAVVMAAAKELGFTEGQLTSIGVSKVFKKYGINVHEFKELKF